ESFSRARQLARGQFWHILGTVLLAWLIVGVLVAVFALALGSLAGMVGINERTMDFLSSLTFIVVFPIVAVASGILYFDLRIRTEAYDVVTLADQGTRASMTPE